MSVIKDAKLGSIESTAKLIASTAESSYESKTALGLDVGDLKCTDVASLSNDYGTCKITFDDNGVATVIVNGKKDGKFNNLACQGTKDNMTCTEGEISTSRKCTTTDTLADNLKFVDGQYTYTYSTSSDGWSVVLTDKTSTDPVTTELCGTINDKPIVSMKSMFHGSKATSLDLSSFDTSNVTNMSNMFQESKATSLDLSSFDTSNVTNMSNMFHKSKATSLDLSSFNTSNVTNMYSMFNNSAATEIKVLENFDTSKVTDMSYMFSWSEATTLNLSSFDTSKVTKMNSMFSGNKVTSLDLSSFDTSSVTDMNSMFQGSAATSLDLSSFDTSKVTDMSNMFWNSKATTGYARSQEDADRFNASSNKPDTLTFIVKQN
ncbi:MAG: BspA family leucine-rich repeat surface protein [Bacilli bacterium]